MFFLCECTTEYLVKFQAHIVFTLLVLMWILSMCCMCFVLNLIFHGFTTMNKIHHSEFSTFIIQKDMKYATIMFIISILAPLCSHGDMGWDIAQRESTHSHLFHCHDQGKKQLTKSILNFQGFLKCGSSCEFSYSRYK